MQTFLTLLGVAVLVLAFLTGMNPTIAFVICAALVAIGFMTHDSHN